MTSNPERDIEVAAVSCATPELVEAFGKLLPQLSTSLQALSLESLADVIHAPSNTVLIARDPAAGGKIVGTLTLVVFRIPTGLRAWIEDVVVDSSARGRGIGEALTLAAVNLAQRRGATTLDLTSRRSREAAHRLYEKVGFSLRDTNVYRYSSKSSA